MYFFLLYIENNFKIVVKSYTLKCLLNHLPLQIAIDYLALNSLVK